MPNASRENSPFSSAAITSRLAKRALLSAMLTPVEKYRIHEARRVSDQQEAIATDLRHRVAVVALVLQGVQPASPAFAAARSAGRDARHSQKNCSRDSRLFAKFAFWVTTPMLVIPSLIGICHTQVFEMGKK